MESFDELETPRTASPLAAHAFGNAPASFTGKAAKTIPVFDLSSSFDENKQNNIRKVLYSEDRNKGSSLKAAPSDDERANRTLFDCSSEDRPMKNFSSEDTVENILNPSVTNTNFILSCADSFLGNSEDAEEKETRADSDEPAEASEAIEEIDETEKLRLQREKEERESQQLIWELMRQEQMELYQLQLEFMQSQSEGFTEEDMRAVQEAMRENNQVIHQISHYPQPAEGQAAPEQAGEEDGDGDEEEQEEEEEEEEEWDYERLLALGQALGGK